MLIIDNLRALSRTFGFVFLTFRSSNQFAQCLNQCSVWLMQSGAEKNKYHVLSQYRIFFFFLLRLQMRSTRHRFNLLLLVDGREREKESAFCVT